MPSKMCTSCKVFKASSEFQEDSRYRSGLRSQCTQCRHERQLDARLDNRLRSSYGVTLQWFKDRLLSQDDRCAICRQTETRYKRPHGTIKIATRYTQLSVDHDHVTGRARGILCHKCNIGLGHFNDDPALLRAAAQYLETV